jgi:hypothetical protein
VYVPWGKLFPMPGHDHVKLLAGLRADGSPLTELVPARSIAEDIVEVLGTPGIVNGCAAGDHIRVENDGSFEVLRRGGNVAVHFYSGARFRPDELSALRTAFEPLHGLVEAPETARFAVVTVPVSAGFPAIEAAAQTWVDGVADVDWLFGNVYDEQDQPLNWWA